MEMASVKYSIKLTGSKLFDVVMYNTAKDLCVRYPGLQLSYTHDEILLAGMITPDKADVLRVEMGEYNSEALADTVFNTKDFAGGVPEEVK